MSVSERALVRAMIIAAGFPHTAVEWMAASCPSIERCKQVCNEHRRRAR